MDKIRQFLHRTSGIKPVDSSSAPRPAAIFQDMPPLHVPHRHPSRSQVLIAVAATLVIGYIGLFAVPRHVTFAYAQATCQTELTLLPKLQEPTTDTAFTLTHPKPLTIGSLPLAATKTCFSPKAAPEPGTALVAVAPMKGFLFRTHYRIVIEPAPNLIMPQQTLELATTKPLRLTIDKSDTTFTYSLATGDKSQSCVTEQTDILCKFDKLGLAQGATHNLKLQRSFDGRKVNDVADINLSVLPAIQVTDASIKRDATVYGKPRSMTFTSDKQLAAAGAKLELIEGDKVTRIQTQQKITGTTLELSWIDDLPREKQFRATVMQAEAADGSTLAAPYITTFRTSGGPKVIGINIGAGAVAGNARIVVTFDQPIAAGVDIAKYASLTGGGATLSRTSTQAIFTLDNLPRCTAFSLHITKGITGENGVISSHDWSHGSRVNCRLTKTIGYSVNGRPIVAYYYGNGGTTILFNGGIHGTEPSGVYIMQDWAAHLDVNAYKIPADKQVVIVPNDNPDAIAANTRYNIRNVNIDRNFPTADWVADTPIRNNQICYGCGGSAPLSEPEAQALASITTALNPRLVLSYHSSGSLVGANDYADSRAIAKLYASGVGYREMFDNAEEIMGHSFSGEYEMWIAEQLKKPAILIELPNATGRFFSGHQNTMWKMVGL